MFNYEVGFYVELIIICFFVLVYLIDAKTEIKKDNQKR